MENRITINPKIQEGKPITKGTRIKVEFILELLSSGMSTSEVINEYPHLKKEDVLAAIEYTVKTIKHEELIFPAEITKISRVAPIQNALKDKLKDSLTLITDEMVKIYH